ncbi:hypothetical protein [Azospirillum rugosum]|uniref:Uncharacterized protein n=1 Tax=Azospirillum rugosum TaxID=416170 RepID=A0ABS4SGF6_9PROT|nr:hypothetical protein [Azospirillum rugosum]MBP2291052.1 hypothetical protein [Azospirillum rugosum]MDQ0524884.1 hypothetical protein [Azospirillum rugosum]
MTNLVTFGPPGGEKVFDLDLWTAENAGYIDPDNGMIACLKAVALQSNNSAMMTAVNTALEAMRRAETAASSATAGTSAALSLSGISKQVVASTTLVDCFIWDVWREVDERGVCWADKVDWASYCNESLDTATRGPKRRPPRQFLVVAHTTKLELYDAWDYDAAGAPRPFMVFPNTAHFNVDPTAGPIRAVRCLNGTIYVCSSGSGGIGLYEIRLSADETIRCTASGTYRRPGLIGQRVSASGTETLLSSSRALSSGFATSVDVAVLPGAPLDRVGLPVPTIVVGTTWSSGATIIHPNGVAATVYGCPLAAVAFAGEHLALLDPGAGWRVGPIPYATVSYAAWQSTAYVSTTAPATIPSGGIIAGCAARDLIVEGRTSGAAIIAPEWGNPSAGMSAHIRADYATPWMVGDVRLCLVGDSLADRSYVGAAVSGTATYAAVNAGDLRATTATSTITAPVTSGGVAYGWLYTAGGWRFCKTMADWGGVVMESGGTLTIAAGTVFTRLVYTTTTPTSAQLARIEADDRPLFAYAAGMLLSGASSNVQGASRCSSTGRLRVSTDAGTTIFGGLVRTAFHSTATTATTSNLHKAAALSGGTFLVCTTAQAAIVQDAVSGKELLLSGRPAKLPGGGFCARGVTADATPVDLAPRVLVGERETALVEARIVGRVYGAADSERISYIRRATVYRDAGGSVALQGSVQTIGTDVEATSSADATFQLDTAAQTVSVRVTGVSGKRIVWTAAITVTRISEENAHAA